jgi:protein SCO1/2
MSARLTVLAAVLAATALDVLCVRRASAELPAFDRVRVLATPKPIDDATLTDQTGADFRLASLRGRVTFVLFGYTNCPDVCPLSMERLRELHSSGRLDGAAVSYVLISVDGERDTPAALTAFLAKYSAEFTGLTADPTLVKPIAAQFSAAFFKGTHTGHDGHYDVAHSPQIFVIDPAGNLRAELYGASLEAMSSVARALLAEAKR